MNRMTCLTTYLLAMLLSCSSLATLAQNPSSSAAQSTKGVEFKNQAPLNKEILKVKLPRGQEATLKNGLRVIVLEDTTLPTFSLRMVILSGGLADPADHRGLAQFTASLLREGTTKRASKEIAEQLDLLGATLTASSGLSSLTSELTASGPVENLDSVLDLFADVIRHPKFPPAEVERFKSRAISQAQLQRSSSQFLGQERFYRAVYSDHPAGLITPPPDSTKKLSSEALTRFHSLHYRPNNSILAITGAVTMKGLIPKLERAFGDWPRGEAPAVSVPPAPAQATTRIHLINRPGSVQTELGLGCLSLERTDPDYLALSVMNHILGGGATRLYLNLREERGYTYSVGSFFTASKFRGIWVASAAVRTDVTDGALREFLSELKRIREEKVSPTELENSKRALIGGFAFSLEQPQDLLQAIIIQQLYRLPADYWETYPQKVAAIAAEDVQRAAQRYLDLAHLQIVAVGDAPKIREVLAKYGKVEVYDADGKLTNIEQGKAKK